MLQVKSLYTYYGNIAALKGVNLSVNQGEIVTLLGRNGVGKTTFLNTVSGALKPLGAGRSSSKVNRIDGMEAHLIALGKELPTFPREEGSFPELTVWRKTSRSVRTGVPGTSGL